MSMSVLRLNKEIKAKGNNKRQINLLIQKLLQVFNDFYSNILYRLHISSRVNIHTYRYKSGIKINYSLYANTITYIENL